MTFFNIYSKKRVEIKKPKIVVDFREKNSLVPAKLMSINCDLEFQNLEVGDYIAGNNIIERKTIEDLKKSLIEKRLFNQLTNLQNNENSLMIIEGINTKIYSGNIHENAIRGIILSLAVKRKIPIIYTINEEDTAKFIAIMAKNNKQNKTSLHPPKKLSSSLEDKVKYILESFPGIGPNNSTNLLEEFHSIKNIINAGEEDLTKILGKRAKEFKELIEKTFQSLNDS